MPYVPRPGSGEPAHDPGPGTGVTVMPPVSLQMLARLLKSSHPEDLRAANKLIKEMVQEVIAKPAVQGGGRVGTGAGLPRRGCVYAYGEPCGDPARGLSQPRKS